MAPLALPGEGAAADPHLDATKGPSAPVDANKAAGWHEERSRFEQLKQYTSHLFIFVYSNVSVSYGHEQL